MLIETVVSRNVPTAGPELDIGSAARLLVRSRYGVLPVVVNDAGGSRVVGVLGYREAFAATRDGDVGRRAMPVATAMTPASTTCRSSDSLGAGLRQLRRSGADALPVLDDRGYLVGLLSLSDLVRDANERRQQTPGKEE